MKKSIYRVLLTFIIVSILISNFNLIFAVDTSKYSGVTKVTSSDMGAFAKFGGQVIYILQFLGYTVAVIMLAVMGIKYIISSPNERADIKSRITPYLIGTLLLFAGSTILNIIYRVVTAG